MTKDHKYRNILLLSADSAEQLRPSDVDRVMDEATEISVTEEFRAWLLGQELMPRTRTKVLDWSV